MSNPGFWLIVAIFSLGLSWLLLCLGGWVMRWVDERIADITLEEGE